MERTPELTILALSVAFIICVLAMGAVSTERSLRNWSMAGTAIALALIGYLFYMSLVRLAT